MDDLDDGQMSSTPPRPPLVMRLGALLPSSLPRPSTIHAQLNDQIRRPGGADTALAPSSSSIPRFNFNGGLDGHAPQRTIRAPPTINWFSWPSTSETCSRDQSPTRKSLATPPSPILASLNEALTSPLPHLPKKPPEAHLHGVRAFSRPPPFLDSLTRCTLPTASISHLDDGVSLHKPSPSLELDSPPSVLYRSPSLGRSSIDSLRSVHKRGISTTASPQLDNTASLSSWWNKKKNVDPLLGEADRAETATEQQERIHKKYLAPKNPVVFCHGLLGFDSVTIGPAIAPLQVTHWRGIKEVLEANSIEVLITRVPATSGPMDRAKVLLEKIEQAYSGRSVHLIGHSMGGLDCRYLTTHLTSRTFKILSVTTVATPHRGSAFASQFLESIGGPSRLSSVLSLLELLPIGGGDGKAFECLTVENMRKFNEDTPDVPGVKYFSWGAIYEPGLIDTWKWPHSVVLEKEGPNDGLVSVESSKWGIYLGTLHQVNHLDLVGWVNTARYKWAEMWGNEINFHPATFYLGIADVLAREVEGIRREEETGQETEQGQDSRRAEMSPTLESHPEASALAKGETIVQETRGDVPRRDDEDDSK